jgi:hypothetical protein
MGVLSLFAYKAAKFIVLGMIGKVVTPGVGMAILFATTVAPDPVKTAVLLCPLIP